MSNNLKRSVMTTHIEELKIKPLWQMTGAEFLLLTQAPTTEKCSVVENAPQPISEKKYTLPEAAEYCRMAEPTFRTYLNKREVTGCKLGKSWLFTQNDLDTFLNRYRVKSKSEIEQVSNTILRRAR